MTDTFVPVAWGIIGAARIADAVMVPALTRSRYSTVAAIGARSDESARSMAARHNLICTTGSYESVLANSDVEAVYIALPNHLHTDWTRRAIAAGKHVLCEKPAALAATDLSGLHAIAGSLKVSEAFMVRHQPRWIELGKILADGRYGPVKSLTSMLSFKMLTQDDFRSRPEFGGGSYFDLGCYVTMTARYVFGAEPLRVFAAMERRGNMVDMSASITLDFGNSRYASFIVSLEQAAAQSLHIACEHASISLPQPFVPATSAPSAILIDTSMDLGQQRAITLEFPAIDQYEEEMANFSRVIRGETAPYFGLDDMIANARVGDAVLSSAESRRWVEV